MQRWRAILFWVLVVELGLVAAFVAVLYQGEGSWLALVVMYLPRVPLLGAAAAGTFLALLTGPRGRILSVLHAIVAVLVLVPVMGLCAGSPRPLERPIRLATWNVFFGNLGRGELLDRIVAIDADVIVLQAAEEGFEDDLRARFPGRTVAQDYELCVVSRFPLRALPPPPSLPDGQRAMFTTYEIDAPGGPLHVVNLHPFSPRQALFQGDDVPGNTTDREEQVRRAVAAAQALGEPFLLAGDTNLPHLSRIAHAHIGDLHDAFAEVGSGFGFTFPAKRPFLRIDRVLGSAKIRFGTAVVGPDGPSDHRPLFVTFEVM